MVYYNLNDVFTAEFAESAEKNHIFNMPLRILPLRALRSRAQRAVNLCLNNNELNSKCNIVLMNGRFSEKKRVRNRDRRHPLQEPEKAQQENTQYTQCN